MSKKQYIGLIVLLLLAGAFAFYWYELRPKGIKERCSVEARFDQRAITEPNDGKRQDFIDIYYNDCLMRFGLK